MGYYPSKIVKMDSETEYRASECLFGSPLNALGTAIKDCWWFYNTGTSAQVYCACCDNGYVAFSGENFCHANRSNNYYCAVIAAADDTEPIDFTCIKCWAGYFFDGSTCISSGMVTCFAVVLMLVINFLIVV